MLSVKQEKNGEKMTIFLEGRLDTSSTSELEQWNLKSAIRGVHHLVLDVSNLIYVSSVGLHLLFTTHEAMLRRQGDMVIRGANEGVLEVLNVTGFVEILNIEN